MHLTPFDFDDLSKDFNEEDSDDKVVKELTYDSILEKIIYLSSAYFCIATELRFLHKKIDKEKYPMKLSEMWHAKAVHTSCWFLPKESPLAIHIHSSYNKHHLKPKLEKMKVMKIEKEKEQKKDIENEKARLLQLEKETQDKILK